MRRRVSQSGRHLDQVSGVIGQLFHDQHEPQGRVFREILQHLESLLLYLGQRRILVSAEILVLVLPEITDLGHYFVLPSGSRCTGYSYLHWALL